MLENSAAVQAVRHTTLGLTAANFWNDGRASAGGIQEHNRHHEKDHQRNKPQDPMGEREREAAQQAPVPVGGAGFWDAGNW